MSGRRMPGTADLRRQAIQQKLKVRPLRSMFAPTLAVGGGWTSLGPLPLPSDASGVGIQDYGWVSGRATAVAIDPNDSTGNTVFVGGAYGGGNGGGSGGASNPGTRPGDYTVTITATCGTVTHSSAVTLTVTP